MNHKKFWIITACIVCAASFFASSHPDGLEYIAEELGFISQAQETRSLFTDYSVPVLGNTPFSTAASGLIGILIFPLFSLILVKFINRKNQVSY